MRNGRGTMQGQQGHRSDHRQPPTTSRYHYVLLPLSKEHRGGQLATPAGRTWRRAEAQRDSQSPACARHRSMPAVDEPRMSCAQRKSSQNDPKPTAPVACKLSERAAHQDAGKSQACPHRHVDRPDRLETGGLIEPFSVPCRKAVQLSDAALTGVAEATREQGGPNSPPHPLGMRRKVTNVCSPPR